MIPKRLLELLPVLLLALGAAAATPAAAQVAVEQGGFRVEFLGCHSAPESVECPLLVTRLGADARLCLYMHGSRLIDHAGHESEGRAVRITGRGRAADCHLLPGGVPLKARATYRPVEPGVRRVALLELELSGPEGVGKIRLRDFPLIDAR